MASGCPGGQSSPRPRAARETPSGPRLGPLSTRPPLPLWWQCSGAPGPRSKTRPHSPQLRAGGRQARSDSRQRHVGSQPRCMGLSAASYTIVVFLLRLYLFTYF